MTVRNAPKPWKERTAAWRAVLAGLLVLVAVAACGADEEPEPAEEATPPPSTEIESAPLEPGTAPPGAGPAEVEETPPERAPLGPELESPPPSPGAGDGAAGEVDEEMPVDPEELEPEIAEADPVPPAPAPLVAAETQAAGRKVFLGQRCDACHGVSSAGIEGKTTAGGDLAGVGQRLDRATFAEILGGGDTPSGQRHPKRFSGSQEELDALIDWLVAQK